MGFSIYALLGEGAPAITDESLESDLRRFFCNEDAFSMQFEKLPFAKNKTLALRWGTWLARVTYEEGANVAQDSEDINKVVGSVAPCSLAGIDKRIRIVFGDDDARQYTNQVVYLLDFLREIPGTILFDPQQRELVN